MMPFRKTTNKPLKNAKGFTMMELMVVIAIIASLAAIAIFNFMPARAKACDTAAFSDARNIVGSVINAMMNDADVNFAKLNTGGAVGDQDTSGISRTPVYVLSPGVAARITGNSNMSPGGNTTIFIAIIWHAGGTPDGTASGRKEFSCSVNEDTGTSTVPIF